MESDGEGSSASEPSYGRRTILVVAALIVVFSMVMLVNSRKSASQQKQEQAALYALITNRVAAALKGEKPVAFVEWMQLQPQLQANSVIAYSGWLQVDGGTNGNLMRWFSIGLKDSAQSNALPDVRSVQIYTNEPRRY
jgi:hypothetical protein